MATKTIDQLPYGATGTLTLSQLRDRDTGVALDQTNTTSVVGAIYPLYTGTVLGVVLPGASALTFAYVDTQTTNGAAGGRWRATVPASLVPTKDAAYVAKVTVTTTAGLLAVFWQDLIFTDLRA